MGCSYDKCIITNLPILPDESLICLFTVNVFNDRNSYYPFDSHSTLPIIVYGDDDEYRNMKNVELSDISKFISDKILGSHDIKGIIDNIICSEFYIDPANVLRKYILSYYEGVKLQIGYVKIKKSVFDFILDEYVNSKGISYSILLEEINKSPDTVIYEYFREEYIPFVTHLLKEFTAFNPIDVLKEYAKLFIVYDYMRANRISIVPNLTSSQEIDVDAYQLHNKIFKQELEKHVKI